MKPDIHKPPSLPSPLAGKGRKGAGISARRVAAMILRYWYLLRSSWPRLLGLTY
jgi:ABC-2 type transport system permease protein